MFANLVCLFILHVFFKHGVPFHIISNRSSEFMSNFFHSLDTTYSFISLQITILKMIDKLNTQIRLLSNTSMYIVTISKTTGLNSYLLWSLLTTMLRVLLLMFLHSSLIRDIIQTSLFTLNVILLPPESATLLQILMSYRVSSKLKYLQSNSIIRSLLICNVSSLCIFKYVTKSLLRLSFSEPLGLQRNSPKNILDPMKSFPSLVYYCSLSVSQSLCALSIQFSMCLCSNLLYPILSPKEHNQPPLQL